LKVYGIYMAPSGAIGMVGIWRPLAIVIAINSVVVAALSPIN